MIFWIYIYLITINCDKEDFLIKGGLWDGYLLYDLYKEASTPYEWHAELFDYAKEIDLTIISTPFDETAVDLLESIDCPFYKVASFENDHYPLLDKIAKTKKPIIISTGLTDLKDLERIVV